jgi:hypothetical protein
MIVARFLDGSDPMEGYHYNIELSIYDYFIYIINFKMFVDRVSKKWNRDYSRMNFQGVDYVG